MGAENKLKMRKMMVCCGCISILILIAIIGVNSNNLAQAKFKCCSKDFVSVDLGGGCGGRQNPGGAFDWDFMRDSGDNPHIIKNKHTTQDSIRASPDCILESEIHGADNAVDSFQTLITKGKIKTTLTDVKLGKIVKVKENQDYDRDHQPPTESIFIPKVKSGTYNLVVDVVVNDESETFYITQIKISK